MRDGAAIICLALTVGLFAGCAYRLSGIQLPADSRGFTASAKNADERACVGGTWAVVHEEQGKEFFWLRTGVKYRQFESALFYCCPVPGGQPVCRRARWTEVPGGQHSRPVSRSRAKDTEGRNSDTTEAHAPTESSARPDDARPPEPKVELRSITTDGETMGSMSAEKALAIQRLEGSEVMVRLVSRRRVTGLLLKVSGAAMTLQRGSPVGAKVAVYPWEKVRSITPRSRR